MTISLIPRRRVWTTPFGAELSRAIGGLAMGFLAAGVATGVAFGATLILVAGDELTFSDGFGIVVTFAGIFAAAGLVLAAPFLLAVMTLERLARVDLGAIAWTLIGYAPTALLAPAVSGGLLPWTTVATAMCAGGWAGLVAHARRTPGERPTRRGASTVAAACLAMLVITMPLAAVLTPVFKMAPGLD